MSPFLKSYLFFFLMLAPLSVKAGSANLIPDNENSYIWHGEGSIKDIAQELAHRNTLESLTLWGSGGEIDDYGVGFLANALEGNKNLKELTFMECTFGSIGAGSLAKMLRSNRTLRKLKISKSSRLGLKGEGALILAGAFEHNKSLGYNSTLEELDIMENIGIDSRTKDLVNKILEKNKRARPVFALLSALDGTHGSNSAVRKVPVDLIRFIFEDFIGMEEKESLLLFLPPPPPPSVLMRAFQLPPLPPLPLFDSNPC